MLKFTTLIFILTTFTLTFNFAQVHQSIHELEYKKNLKEFPNSVNDENLRKFNILPLNKDAKREITKSVFGYLPYWEYPTAKSLLRYDLLSHIALFSFSLNSNGSISNPPGGEWPWTDVINSAHTNGVKVVMSVINFNVTESQMHSVLVDSTLRTNFINSVKSKITTYNLDGVNIDFESRNIADADRGSVINNFMSELTDSVHALSEDYEVSYAAPAVNWDDLWDLEGLANSCDYLFIMGYDFYGSWSDNTGPTAPLTGGSYNISNTINIEYGNIIDTNPEKLILGVPYFGPHWTTSTNQEGSATLDYVGASFFRSAQPQSEVYGIKWSTNFRNSWYSYADGFTNHQVWFDNDSSLGLKYDLAISKNLKGVGIWALGYDGTRTELWNLITERFGDGQLPVPSQPTEFNVIVIDNSTLQLNFSNSDYAEKYEIYISEDGDEFGLHSEAFTNSVEISNLDENKAYFFKVRSVNTSGTSFFSEVLGGIPSDQNRILIVNGFDRTQNTDNTYDYIKYHAVPILLNGYEFSSSSNEAVYKGEVDLTDYDYVFWMLLDESTSDETFNQIEQEKVKTYLQMGGNFFVSGAEIGWDLVDKGTSTDLSFYQNFLKADYVDDAPNEQSGTYYSVEAIFGSPFSGIGIITFDDGTNGTIDVDWPDAIKSKNGSEVILKYVGVSENSGAAGVAFSGIFDNGFIQSKLIHLSFPYETVYNDSERTILFSKIMNYFNSTVDVSESTELPTEFSLEQNYPNPFNPTTTIEYTIPNSSISLSNVKLNVFDILGREVATLVNEKQNSGYYKIEFNAANLPSGTYFYRLQSGDFLETKKMIILK